MNHYTSILLELYKRKIYTSMPLFDKQLEALNVLEDNVTNEVLYGGSARSGKSVLGCDWQIFRRLSMPESYSLIAREELTKLKDTTLLTFFKRLKYWGIERDVDYSYNAQDQNVIFSNGSRIFFREIKYLPSDEEFDRLGSYDLTDAFLDEAQQIHSKAPQVLKGRFSVTVGNGWKTIPKILYTCNPSKTWIYTDFVKPAKEGKLEDRKRFIPALPSDNPHVPKSFFINLATADKTTKERLLYGNFEYDDDPSVLIDYERIIDIFTNNFPALSGRRYITADIARKGKDSTVIAIWDGFRCVKLIRLSKALTTETAAEINRVRLAEQIPLQNVICDEDGVGGGVVDMLGCQGFVNNSKARGKKNYANLKTQCYFALAERVNNSGLYVACEDPAVREMIVQELEQVKQDKIDQDGKIYIVSKDQVKERLGRSPDYSDALMMREYFELNRDGMNPFVTF